MEWKEHKTQSESGFKQKIPAGLKRLIGANPSTSITLAKKPNVSIFTVSSAVEGNLDLANYVRYTSSMPNSPSQSNQSHEVSKASALHQASRGKRYCVFFAVKFTVDATFIAEILFCDYSQSFWCTPLYLILRALSLWWCYLEPWRMMEMTWIHALLSLAWWSARRGIWTSWGS